MVDGHRAMERWGVYSIFKEAGRLLYQHFRIFRPFILAFMLPLALILFLEVIGLAWFLTWVGDQVQPQPHHFGGLFGHHHHSGFHAFYAAFSKVPNPSNPVLVLELLLIIFTITLLILTICWVLQSLATTAIAKAIYHIYSSNNNTSSSNEDINTSQSQTLALTQSIFTSLPHCFYRIFIVSLCFFVIDILTYFFLVFPFFLLSKPQFEPYHLQMLYTWLWNLVFLILDFWFLVSVQVVVLENQYYGWAVLQRSAKLVKAKGATALGLLIVYIVYFCILNWVLPLVIVIPFHSVMLYAVAGTLAVGCLVFGAFWLVVMTVFYFVSKFKCSSGGEEGRRQVEGELYQALDVSVEN